MATTLPKILRIGIIQSGKIIEEQLIRKSKTLYFGNSPKSDFIVTSPAFPSKYPLFIYKGNQYFLNFTDQMKGKVDVKGGGGADFQAIKQQGLCKKHGKGYLLPLTTESRGRVTIGDTTILFQFIVAPPAPIKPKLPKEARGGWLKSIDLPFAAITATSFILQSVFIIYLNSVEIPKEISIDKIPDRFAKLIVPKYKPERKKVNKVKSKKGKGTSKKKAKKAAAKKTEKKAPKKNIDEARQKALHKAKIREKVKKKGLLKLLGSKGPGTTNTMIEDVLADGSVDGDLKNAFKGGVEVASAESLAKAGRKTGGAEVGKTKIGDLATSGAKRGSLKGRSEARIVGSVSASTPEVDGNLDQKAVARSIKRRLGAIKACYNRELKRNPDLKGKIVVRFTIETNGRVGQIFVVSNTMGNDKVANCIINKMRRWRFPRPSGGPVGVSFPFVFSASS